MQAVILKCKPNSQFHFGKLGVDPNTSLNDTSEWLHSDTLFSSIVNILAQVHDSEEVKQLITYFRSGDITISSAYYTLEIAGTYLYFLPKPVHYDLQIKTNFKRLGQIKFLSKGVWEAGLAPRDWERDECVILQGKFVVLKKELSASLLRYHRQIKFYDTIQLPKVAIHKPTKEDSHYYQANLQIGDLSAIDEQASVHFYFLINTSETFAATEAYSKILNAILLMTHTGIGGERSTGCGWISDVEPETFDLDLPDSGRGITLSLAIPASEQELKQFHYSTSMLRGGRNTGTGEGNLQVIRMIAEGALCDATVEGTIADISPDATDGYLRYGKAFTLPIHQKILPL